MEPERPLVSVVLPTYNRPEMVLEAVESVAAQGYPAVELIVVDDGSSNPIEEVLTEFAPCELQWRCLRHTENRGANAARNTGIRDANGEIVAFLDDDDRWKPGKLEAQVDALENEAVGLAVVGQEFVAEDGETTATRLPTVEPGLTTSGLLESAVAGPFSTIAVRRSVVEAAGLPDERFPAWQDREWLLRLSLHCRFETIREPLVIRRFGSYAQIADEFEQLRDTTYPLFVDKHRELAATHGREREFLAHLAMSIAGAGVSNGYYRDARRFAAKAIRRKPQLLTAYLYLALALGGQHTHHSATRLKRAVERTKRSLLNGI